MAVAKGKVNAGSSFFGLYLPFRFPLFPRRYAVYVEGKRNRVSKQCDPFVGEPIKQLAGHEVEVVMSKEEIFAIRGLGEELKHIIVTCYLCPIVMVFTPRVLQETRKIMNQTLIEQKVIQADAVDQAEKWHEMAQGMLKEKG
jgi:hypothetical protein